MHVFAEASELEFAECAYLWIRANGKIECDLIAARSKVNAIKPITLPRVELNATVLAAKLVRNISSINHDMKIETFAWNDFEIALT